MEELKVGDVVQLKSGGPKMTIDYLEESKAYCVWFDKRDKKSAEFKVASLTKAE